MTIWPCTSTTCGNQAATEGTGFNFNTNNAQWIYNQRSWVASELTGDFANNYFGSFDYIGYSKKMKIFKFFNSLFC